MQTFLPVKDFFESARLLDRARLGKQRVEAWQILRALNGETKGWVNHPATRMWRGHEVALARYGWAMCAEWIERGYNDTLLERFRPIASSGRFVLPSWIGITDFHLSHQSNLIRKLPEFYAPLFPGVPDDLPYIWPVYDLTSSGVII